VILSATSAAMEAPSNVIATSSVGIEVLSVAISVNYASDT